MARKRILGTEALFEETEAVAEALVRQPDHLPQDVPISQLVPSRFNPRHTYSQEAIQHLTRSILDHGFIGALDGRELPDGRVELAYGSRRLLAARRAGLRALPVALHTWSDAQMCLISLVENLSREGLSCADETDLVAQLREGLRVADQAIADAAGKPREWVAERAATVESHETAEEDPDALRLEEVVASIVGDSQAEGTLPVYELDVARAARFGLSGGPDVDGARATDRPPATASDLSWMETGSTMLVLAADALQAFDPSAVEARDIETAQSILSELAEQIDEFQTELAQRS
jgi:ParB/RepB/Spo0J family partition protein